VSPRTGNPPQLPPRQAARKAPNFRPVTALALGPTVEFINRQTTVIPETWESRGEDESGRAVLAKTAVLQEQPENRAGEEAGEAGGKDLPRTGEN